MIIIFSQYMRHLYIPLGTYKWRIFELFPVLLGIVSVWIYGARGLGRSGRNPRGISTSAQPLFIAVVSACCSRRRHGARLPRHPRLLTSQRAHGHDGGGLG